MSEADGVRDLAYQVAEKAREANIALVQAQRAIQEMIQGILILDLSADNMHVRSAARFGPGVGREISSDLETLLMIESEMRQWMDRL